MATNQIATLGVKVDPRGAVTGANRAKRAITGIGNSARNVKNRIMSMQGALLGLGAGAILKSIITTASSVESLQVRLKFLTGSTEEAAKAFETMNTFASKVPFSLEEIERASPLLLTVAKDAGELNNLLAITGDIAAISGLSFEATAGQLQRSMAGGIAAADLFRERGVKAFLGFKEGVQYTAAQTKKLIEDMWKNGTTTAKGATEELADTFQGQVSMMQDAWRELKLAIADAGVFESASKVVLKLTALLKDEQTIENMKKFGAGITSVGKAVGSVVNTLMGLPDWVLEFGVVVAFLGGKKAKYAIVLITSLTLGFQKINQAIEDFKNQTTEDKLVGDLEKLNNRFEVTKEKLKLARIELSEFIAVSGEDIGKMSTANVIEYDRLVKAVKKYAEELPKTTERILKIHDALETERKSVVNLKDEYRALTGLHTEVWNDQQPVIVALRNIEELHAGYRTLNTTLSSTGASMDAINNHMNKNSMLAIIAANSVQALADAQELAKQKTKEFADGMAMNIEDSIMRMTQGLMSFKDVVGNVFKYVAMEMVRANIAKPLASSLSGILTGSADYGGKGDGGVLGSIFGSFLGKRATGGNVNAGQPYMVGERGAELFVPKGSGDIVPNNKMGGSTVVNVTYAPQVNALDPRTASTVLIENAPLIVGVIRQAFERNGQQVAL